MVWKKIKSKIKSRDELKEIVANLKKEGKKIIHTSGAYDIVHEGHVFLLTKAKELGDVLIVSLNTDDSIKRFKGNDRPVLSEKTRTTVMAAMGFVDYVTLFPEDEVLKTLEILKPDIHVKGRGVVEERIKRERELMNAMGGEMILIEEDMGNSTTQIMSRMVGEHTKDIYENKNNTDEGSEDNAKEARLIKNKEDLQNEPI